MKGVHVTSEIGVLRKVLLHRPGKELLYLTPSNRGELLFDDIPYLEKAMEEHNFFSKVLKENGVEVLYLEDLMAEVLDLSQSIKEEFVQQFLQEANISSYKDSIYQYLMSFINSKDLVLKTMEGIQVQDIDPSSEQNRLLINPLPNLYFARDNFASIGSGISLNHMYSKTRNRECIYAEYIFKYHPDYKDVFKYYDRSYPWSIEGGDILILNENVLVVGISERTEMDAIKELAKNCFQNPSCEIDRVVALQIPSRRACMHLDTVFTQVDSYTFTYYPGILDTLQVFEINKDLRIVEMNDSLDKILEKYLSHPVKLIPCAGGDIIAAEREQWSDGVNTLCIRPGVVLVYDRNKLTNEVLRREGIKVIEIPSSELSRGRGGPRCMSMPLLRDE